jgi:hypothetical protein
MLHHDFSPSPDDAPLPCELCGDTADTTLMRVNDSRPPRRQCWDGTACQARIAARDAHMNERFTITCEGREALQFIEQAEQLPLTAEVA